MPGLPVISPRQLMGRLALGFVFAATPASAAQAADVEGWVVDRNEDGDACFMSTVFQDDVMFSIFWDPRLETNTLVVSSEHWDSLTSRKGETAKIRYTLRGNVEYDEWWTDNGLIVVTDSGREAISATWERKDAADFAVSFALADAVSVEADGRSLGGYNLAGTYKAMLALRKCGSEILREGRDPFAP